MSVCQCRTTIGGTIVCDFCAAQMIEAIQSLIPGDSYAVNIADVLTPGELKGLNSVVDDWLKQQGRGQEKEAAQW